MDGKRRNSAVSATLVDVYRNLKLCDDAPHEYDLAEWNLLLAQGLPGAESLDVPKLLDTLNDWADDVRRETERLYYHFLDDPRDYENSQGYFCVLVLITVLERDLGVRYNPERVRDASFQDPFCVDPDFKDSKDLFIHGILDGPGGTCSSMPVLYTSVGRRLGYPMKLVEAPGHLFSRWDDPTGSFNGVADRFNIDASGQGFASHSDEHYLTWPRPWKDVEKEHDWYLVSMTPHGEIAGFLATKGACLEDNGKLDEAFQCFHWAYQLTKDERYYGQAGKLQHSIATRDQRLLNDINEAARNSREQLAHVRGEQAPKPISKSVSPAMNMRDVGHGPACRCQNCQRERSSKLVQAGGDFGHGPSCQCLHCRENHQIAKSAGSQQSRPHPQLPGFP